MDRLQREEARVWADAELVLAERLDPDDTLPLFVAIAGHEAELRELYEQLLDEDPVIQSLRGEHEDTD